MTEQMITIETKCRRCGDIRERYIGRFGGYTHQDITKYMHEKIQFPSIYDCSECKKKTVQDVVAYNNRLPLPF